MSIPRLVIASKNQGKIEEISALMVSLGLAAENVPRLDWPDVEETGATLEANAILKAEAVVEVTGLPALADDTGLEVEALSGRPGVHSARYAGPDATFDDNIAKLLAELEGAGDRSARFVTVVALAFPDGVTVSASGSLEGRIALERRGTGGFGYDPVFEVDGRTLSEMGQEAKNRLSHRARALRDLARTLGL